MFASAQIMSPLNRQSRQLFHAAIMDAGVPHPSTMSTSDERLRKIKNIVEFLFCETNTAEKMLACLRSDATLEELLDGSFVYDKEKSEVFKLYPTLDGEFLPEDDLAPKDFTPVRVLIGTTHNEGVLFFKHAVLSNYSRANAASEEDFSKLTGGLARYFSFPVDFNDATVRANVLRTYYGKTQSKRQDASIVGDGLFACPIEAFIDAYSRSHSNVYVYDCQRPVPKATPVADSNEFDTFHASPFVAMFSSLRATAAGSVEDEDRVYALDNLKMLADFVKFSGRTTVRRKVY